MATSNQSTGETLFDQTLFVVATPVNHLALPGNGKENKTQDTCGLGYDRPLANYDLITQSWKMLEAIYLWGDCPLLENLPPSGMTQNGALFLQPAWVPITGETESLSWPTPRVTGSGENIAKIQERFRNGLKYNSRLEEAVAQYPTMSASGMGNTGSQQKLQKLVDDGSLTDEEKRGMTAGNGGRLNPTWVEWLMGFPLGWTDLEDLETL
jgi:hypothetical protein